MAGGGAAQCQPILVSLGGWVRVYSFRDEHQIASVLDFAIALALGRFRYESAGFRNLMLPKITTPILRPRTTYTRIYFVAGSGSSRGSRLEQHSGMLSRLSHDHIGQRNIARDPRQRNKFKESIAFCFSAAKEKRKTPV